MGKPILGDVSVVNGRRIVRATVDGHVYDIPEHWLIAYCQFHEGANALDAAQGWHDQEQVAGPVPSRTGSET